ncbi:MAG: SWIM zinc finger family protein [Candidatus Entotheonellia bacterium]
MAEQSGPLPLTEEQLAQAIEEKTFHRAQPYVREFTHRLRSGPSIAGRVAGPHGSYTVSLGIEGSALTPACSCTSDAGFCKHVIALGLTYIEEPQSFYDLRTLTAQLEQSSHSELVTLIIRIGTRYPQTLGMLGVEGFADEEDEDVIDDDELYDDEEDDFEDDEDDLDEEDEDFEDDEDEEALSGRMDVEAIYEQADLLLEEFQDFLKGRGVAREDRMGYDEMLQVFVDDYLAAYEVGKLTDMNRDEIDTYLREYLLERERISKRKLAETKQAFAHFYTFLYEQGHMPQEIAQPIIQYCQR